MLEIGQAAGIVERCWNSTDRQAILLVNGSVIEFRSWHKIANLQGPSIHWLVVDEAGLLTKQARAMLSTRRSATLGPARYIGNPTSTGSAFWELCQQAIDYVETWDGKGIEHFAFSTWTYKDRAAALPASWRARYLRFIANEKRELDPVEFSRWYEALWATPERAILAKTLATMAILEQSSKPHVDILEDGTVVPHPYLIAWDIGLVVDWTVGFPLCLKCFTCTDIKRFRPSGWRTADIAKVIADYSATWNNGTAVIETNGPGGPVCNDVAAIYKRTQPWWTDNNNKRAGIFEIVRRGNSGGLTVAQIPAMMEEMRVYQSFQNPKSGIWTFAGPSGKHDDIVSACIIAIGAATSGAAAFIESMRSELEQKKKQAEAQRGKGA